MKFNIYPKGGLISFFGMILESFLIRIKTKLRKEAKVISGRTRVLTEMPIFGKGMKETGGGGWPYCFIS